MDMIESIIGFFRKKESAQQSKDASTNIQSALPADPPPPPPSVSKPTEHKVRIDELTRIWKRNGALSLTLPANTSLWHTGTALNVAQLSNDIALWCTCNGAKQDYYNEWAKEDARRLGVLPFKLTLATNKELVLADFACQSLREFTQDYCESDHSTMKKALRDWCMQNNFCGVQRINRDPDEVVICNPVQDLAMVATSQL